MKLRNWSDCLKLVWPLVGLVWCVGEWLREDGSPWWFGWAVLLTLVWSYDAWYVWHRADPRAKSPPPSGELGDDAIDARENLRTEADRPARPVRTPRT